MCVYMFYVTLYMYRCTTCYFDMCMYCDMIAFVELVITLHNYSTVLLSIFILPIFDHCGLFVIHYKFLP